MIEPRHPSLLRVSYRLQPRDCVLAVLLDQHKVLTTGQVTAILFASPRTCRNRLDTLHRLGFVNWFTPPGRHPMHWAPGLLSARYAALARGERPPTAKALRETQDSLVASSHLRHTVGANQFFTDLLAHAREHPHTRLARWWSPAHAADAVGRRVRPDAHGIWREHTREVAFFLEHDTGNQRHRTLAAKLQPYRRLRAVGGPDWPILFWLPTTARETNFHNVLTHAAPDGVTVATAARDTAAVCGGPAGPVWRLAGNGRRRLRLAELPSTPGRPGPYHPGPATPEQDPLYLLDPD